MPLSRNENDRRAIAVANERKDDTGDGGEAKSFRNGFFHGLFRGPQGVRKLGMVAQGSQMGETDF